MVPRSFSLITALPVSISVRRVSAPTIWVMPMCQTVLEFGLKSTLTSVLTGSRVLLFSSKASSFRMMLVRYEVPAVAWVIAVASTMSMMLGLRPLARFSSKSGGMSMSKVYSPRSMAACISLSDMSSGLLK